MIEWQDVQETNYRPVSITCSKCKTTYRYDSEDLGEQLKIQEFVGFDGIGGYGSVIGDEVYWQIHLCERCFVDLCGDYLEYPEDDEE